METKLSWQEHWTLGRLQEGVRTLHTLPLMLPAADTRTRRTQAASLSRTLRSWVVRGVAVKTSARVYRPTG